VEHEYRMNSVVFICFLLYMVPICDYGKQTYILQEQEQGEEQS
jgi:p-aminobenzoyl-glutamate transporter AbgT